MTDVYDYANLSARVYDGETPQGWKLIKKSEPTDTGFQAAAYMNKNGEIVIAYAGTNDPADVVADVQLGIGIGC